MRCDEIRPLLSVGLDGELEESRAARVRAHLADCAPCAAEREALAVTVRLLHDLPEAEPPVELRRRIAVALLEMDRRAERRWLGFAWLARPHTAGWAWGAALGAVVATVALVTTHGPAPPRAVAVVPSLQTRAKLSTPSGVWTALKPAVGARPRPSKTASAPPARPLQSIPNVAKPPEPASTSTPLKVEAPTVARHSTAPSPAPVHRVMPVARHERPISAAPRRPRLHGPAHSDAPVFRPEATGSEGPMAVRPAPASTASASGGDRTDPESWPDTSGMTQMASGGDPAVPATPTDDLSELRQHLTNRPLQAPQLGELKNSERPSSGRDGWIRF